MQRVVAVGKDHQPAQCARIEHGVRAGERGGVSVAVVRIQRDLGIDGALVHEDVRWHAGIGIVREPLHAHAGPRALGRRTHDDGAGVPQARAAVDADVHADGDLGCRDLDQAAVADVIVVDQLDAVAVVGRLYTESACVGDARTEDAPDLDTHGAGARSAHVDEAFVQDGCGLLRRVVAPREKNIAEAAVIAPFAQDLEHPSGLVVEEPAAGATVAGHHHPVRVARTGEMARDGASIGQHHAAVALVLDGHDGGQIKLLLVRRIKSLYALALGDAGIPGVVHGHGRRLSPGSHNPRATDRSVPSGGNRARRCASPLQCAPGGHGSNPRW